MTALELHTTAADPGRFTIDVIGPIIGSTNATLREHLRAILTREPAVTARLDLRCCTRIDLDGLFGLVTLRHELVSTGGELHLVQVPPLVERFLRQHNFEKLIGDDSEAGPSRRPEPLGEVLPFPRAGADMHAGDSGSPAVDGQHAASPLDSEGVRDVSASRSTSGNADPEA